jgi:hypothetical protein
MVEAARDDDIVAIEAFVAQWSHFAAVQGQGFMKTG